MPKKVELVPHSASWQVIAQQEILRLTQALSWLIVEVHHIGSTAIPGIHAKPIIDLMPVARSIDELDKGESVIRQLGYRYRGENGIVGRRYCTFDDPSTGRRRFQVHCFASGSHEIERHLAFREYLRAHSEIALEYDAEKRRCRELHPDDSNAYCEAKADWIAGLLPVALANSACQFAKR